MSTSGESSRITTTCSNDGCDKAQTPGGFRGRPDVQTDGEARGGTERARRLGLIALAQTLPRQRVEELVRALVEPCGPGSTSILTVNEMTAGVRIDETGAPEVELPNVAASLRLMLDHGHAAGVLLRAFTDRTAITTEAGLRIPVKELRGWAVRGGRLLPLSAAEVFNASCTDSGTGEPLPPERGVAYLDAWDPRRPGRRVRPPRRLHRLPRQPAPRHPTRDPTRARGRLATRTTRAGRPGVHRAQAPPPP